MGDDQQTATAAQLEQRTNELRADLTAAKGAEQAASKRAREATIRGDEDADAAVRARFEARAKVETLTEAVREVEALIPQTKQAEATAAGEKRMLGIHKAYTSLLTQRENDIVRLQGACAAYVEALERLNARHINLDTLIAEALVLAERFAVVAPELSRPPAADKRVSEALKRTRATTPAVAHPLPPRLIDVPARGGGWSLRRVMERVAGTPTADLLASAGLGVLGDAEAWEERRRRQQDETRDRGDAARRAEVERYTVWLKAALAAEPVRVDDLNRQAVEAGLRLLPDRNHFGASIKEAADRLGAQGVVEETNGPIWWALPNVWDGQRFVRMSEATALGRMRV